MKKLIVIALLVTGLFSCTQKGSEHSANDESETSDTFNVQTASFTELDTSGILLFPFGRNSYDESGTSIVYGSSYESRGEDAFWNILFVNTKTNEQHLLTDQKIIIKDFTSVVEEAGVESPLADYIFYIAVSDDTDRDGAFTNDDARYLFVSDRMGNQFRRISSKGYNVRQWKYIKSSGKIFLLAAKDSDNNKKYDNEDESTAFEIDIKNNAPPQEVLSPAVKIQLRKIFDKNWKNKQQ